MATTTTQMQHIVKVAEDEYLLLHPETDAEIVKVAAAGITADNVEAALGELHEQIEGITGGGVVTGVKGEAEETYRKGQVNITKANVGLGNVDNTADADKPVSTAQKAALEELAKRISDLPPWGNIVFYTAADGTPWYSVYAEVQEPTQRKI